MLYVGYFPIDFFNNLRLETSLKPYFLSIGVFFLFFFKLLLSNEKLNNMFILYNELKLFYAVSFIKIDFSIHFLVNSVLIYQY